MKTIKEKKTGKKTGISAIRIRQLLRATLAIVLSMNIIVCFVVMIYLQSVVKLLQSVSIDINKTEKLYKQQLLTIDEVDRINKK